MTAIFQNRGTEFRMQMFRYAVATSSILMVSVSAAAQMSAPGVNLDAQVRINQIQVIGTHNSYHAGLPPSVAKLLEQENADVLRTLDYAHADLATQLDHGVRQIELDIFVDSKGGHYAHPFGPTLVSKFGLSVDPDPYPSGVMLKPGFKVMHAQDIDYVSNCQPFVACLAIVRQWSRQHSGHVPIFILVETKSDMPEDTSVPWTVPEPWTPRVFDALDAEIRSVFPAGEMITPDQVRGRHRTLEEAVRHGAWPTLAQVRGKVLFLMDQQWAGSIYLQGHPSLRRRLLFTNATPGHPEAAFVEKNEGSRAEISELVRQGYLVRTRADVDTAEARTNDTRRRDTALNSGAQIVSTDYPAFEPSRWTGYYVALPSAAPARCNPVTTLKESDSTLLESPANP